MESVRIMLNIWSSSCVSIFHVKSFVACLSRFMIPHKLVLTVSKPGQVSFSQIFSNRFLVVFNKLSFLSGINASRGSYKIEERASQFIIVACNGKKSKEGAPGSPTCPVVRKERCMWPLASLDQKFSHIPGFAQFCHMGQVSLSEVYRHNPLFTKGDQVTRDSFRRGNSLTLVFTPLNGNFFISSSTNF